MISSKFGSGQKKQHQTQTTKDIVNHQATVETAVPNKKAANKQWIIINPPEHQDET